MYKMIVVDLDGTLLNEKREITTNTITYLKSLKDKGMIITIATGRIYASAIAVTRGAIFADYLITDNGSSIYDLKEKKPIIKNLISKEIAETILSYYDDTVHFIDICDDNYFYELIEKYKNNNRVIYTQDKNFILNNCKEITHASIGLKDNSKVEAMYEKLKKEIKEIDFHIMQDSFEEKKWIEIVPKGCNKHNAVTYLSHVLSLKKEDILVFGDGLNDKEMIEKCGYGVALKNALPCIKEVAQEITKKDYREEGVICYLKELFEKEGK